MLQPGDRFPTFSLQDQHGATVTNDDLKGQPTVVFFYPKADTSGCTVEACGFRDALPQLAGRRVIGVSPDQPKAQAKWDAKHGLGYPLLADVEHRLAEACGIWVEKSMYGKKYMGVERTTYLLDSDGVVAHVFSKVKPEGHAAEVLAKLGA